MISHVQNHEHAHQPIHLIHLRHHQILVQFTLENLNEKMTALCLKRSLENHAEAIINNRKQHTGLRAAVDKRRLLSQWIRGGFKKESSVRLNRAAPSWITSAQVYQTLPLQVQIWKMIATGQNKETFR